LYAPYQVGGAERSVEEIAKFLSIENSVVVITLRDKSDHILQNREFLEGVTVVRFPLKFRYWPFPKKNRKLFSRAIWHTLDLFNLQLFLRLFLELARNRPDVVMTHNLTGFSVSPWFVAKLLKIPVVHLLHDYNLLCPNTTMRNKSKNCTSICFQCKFRRNVSNSSPKPKALVGVSDFILNTHRKYLRFSKHTLFDVAHGSASFIPKSRNHITYNFGFLGGLNEVKGIDLFISAAKNLPDKSFVIAGKPNKEFLQKIDQVPNIVFLGWCNSVEFYSLVEVLIVPSVWNDPAPRVILEASHAGVPVVISNLPTLVEIAKYNDCSYSVFEPGDPSSLVEVLKSLPAEFSKVKDKKSLPSQGEQILKILIQISQDLGRA
jgi:glycosyltransferase involved in cell wall biosynthesis